MDVARAEQKQTQKAGAKDSQMTKRELTRIIVVSNPKEGVLKIDQAVSEHRKRRVGWKSLNERLASREAANSYSKDNR